MKFTAEITQDAKNDQWYIHFTAIPEWLADVFIQYNQLNIGSTKHTSGRDSESLTGGVLICAKRRKEVEND